tara:strand:+ start:2760 stop:2984 length:225 start_codon:yes stop_codon:yes gene_type:complete
MQGLKSWLSIVFASFRIGKGLGSAIIGMQFAIRHAFLHAHAKDAIQPKGVTELHAHDIQNKWMVDQVYQGLPPG